MFQVLCLSSQCYNSSTFVSCLSSCSWLSPSIRYRICALYRPNPKRMYGRWKGTFYYRILLYSILSRIVRLSWSLCQCSPEMEVKEIILAKVLRLCQLSSHSCGFLSRLYIFLIKCSVIDYNVTSWAFINCIENNCTVINYTTCIIKCAGNSY